MRVLGSPDGTTAEFKGLTAVQLAQHQQKAGLEGQLYRQINSLVWDPTHQATIQKGTPRHWRRCGGYNLDRMLPEGVGGVSFNWPQDGLFNLAKLVSGGEGTLAVMSDITLNLVPLPAHTGVAIVHFNALFEALESVPTMLEAPYGLPASCQNQAPRCLHSAAGRDTARNSVAVSRGLNTRTG